LDEIEKAHINVFDLCLQIFDAGRLTDGRGRTVDFRRTIIILTSNVGATTGLVGFGAKDSHADAKPARDKMPIELSRFFRPAFLNRLDRIIQFGPLSLEVAEQIARKEIQSVLHRSGIKRRDLVVEVDPSVVSLIVKEGYSLRFGARPLKRTVEKLLLLPLARAISSGSLQRSSIVRLSSHANRIRVTTLSQQNKPTPSEQPASQTNATNALAEVRARYERLDEAIQAMAARKTKLIAQTRDPEFFRNKDHRVAVFPIATYLSAFSPTSSITGIAPCCRRESGNVRATSHCLRQAASVSLEKYRCRRDRFSSPSPRYMTRPWSAGSASASTFSECARARVSE